MVLNGTATAELDELTYIHIILYTLSILNDVIGIYVMYHKSSYYIFIIYKFIYIYNMR